MEDGFIYLMSVFNRIEAENVYGILGMEGIDVRLKFPGRQEFTNIESNETVDIYVPSEKIKEARSIIETEMVRGDL